MVDIMARPWSQWAHESHKAPMRHPLANTNNIPEQHRPPRPEATFTNPHHQIASHGPACPRLPQISTSPPQRRTSVQSSHVSSLSPLDRSPSIYWDSPQAYEPSPLPYTGSQSRCFQPSPMVLNSNDTYPAQQPRETTPTRYAALTDRPWHRITARQQVLSLSSVLNDYSSGPPSPSTGLSPPREFEANTPTRTHMRAPRQSPHDAMAVQALLNADSTSTRASGKAAVRKECADAVRYQLVWRQKPLRARNCGCGDKDRRAVDPPPILELKVDGSEAAAQECLLRSMASYIVHCSIWSEDGATEVKSKPSGPPRLRQLIGNLVASPFPGHDEHGREGCFFTFPDLSVRDTGFYRLKFSLVTLDSRPGAASPITDEVMSDVIHVWPAKGFPGMLKSSALVMALKEQGCSIPAKKGNDNDDNGADAEEGEGEEEEEGGGGGGGGGGNDHGVSGAIRQSIESPADGNDDDDEHPRKRAKLKH